MTAFRRFAFAHRAVSAWVIALAVLLKVVVPAGTMIGPGSIGLVLCTGSGPVSVSAVPGSPDKHDRRELPCAFAGLSAPSLAAAGPPVLPVTVVGPVATTLCLASAARVEPATCRRPPVRGPPTIV